MLTEQLTGTYGELLIKDSYHYEEDNIYQTQIYRFSKRIWIGNLQQKRLERRLHFAFFTALVQYDRW